MPVAVSCAQTVKLPTPVIGQAMPIETEPVPLALPLAPLIGVMVEQSVIV